MGNTAFVKVSQEAQVRGGGGGRWWSLCEVEHSLGRGGGGCHQHLITRLTLSPSPFLLALQGLQGPLQRQPEGWAGTPWWQWRVAPHPHPRLFFGYLSSHWSIPFHRHRLMDLGVQKGSKGSLCFTEEETEPQ